jgi:hypothetical protein
MGTFVGFDPGGAGAFGWAVLVGEELALTLVHREFPASLHEITAR